MGAGKEGMGIGISRGPGRGPPGSAPPRGRTPAARPPTGPGPGGPVASAGSRRTGRGRRACRAGTAGPGRGGASRPAAAAGTPGAARGPRQPPGRQVRPEQDLGVAGHPPLELGAGVVVGRRDVVQDPACRGEDAGVARPAEAEGEVDVLVVGAEDGSKPPTRRRASAR